VVRLGNAVAMARVTGGLPVDFWGLWCRCAMEVGLGRGFGFMGEVVEDDEEFGYMAEVVEVNWC
jgi:hypothetical protein